MFQVGETVSIIRLKNAYDALVVTVLADSIEYIYVGKGDKKKRPPAQYKILKRLPTKDEYSALKVKRFTTTIDGVFEDAKNSLEELASEIREAYDQMPESLQQGSRGETIDNTASTLEGLDFDDCPEVCSHIEIVYFPSADLSTRSKRASEYADMLTTIKSHLDDWVAEHKPDDEESVKMTFKDSSGADVEVEVDWSELEEFGDACERLADEIQNCEFPGYTG